MKKLLFLLAILLGSVTFAQQTERQHRIIMQLTSGDTLVHKNLMKQFKNCLLYTSHGSSSSRCAVSSSW